MIKEKCILWLSFFCCVAGVFDVKAEDNVLLAALLPQQCAFAGEFTQTRTLKGIPMPLVSSGKFFFSCDNGLIWQTSTPIIETLIYSKQKRYFQIQDDGQVQRLKTRLHAYLAQMLLSLMGADTEYLKQNFVISEQTAKKQVKQDQVAQEADVMSVVLQVRNKRLKKFLREIIIQQQSNTQTIEMINIDQQTTLIEISQTQYFDEKDDVMSRCLTFLKQQDKACDVLLHANGYQTKTGS